MSKKLNGLYVISDDILTPKETILEQIEKALKGGASIVQLRDKISSDEQIEYLVKDLENLCEKYKALFVLNDRVELAIKLKCSGLHIGESDYHRIETIRKDFDGILGISCYGDAKTAKQMEDLGADYVAFGSFFTSPTKPNSKVVNKEVLSEAKSILNIPICAIGGITLENSLELLDRKTNMLAVISDIWKEKDIEAKCKKYKEKF